MSGDDGVERSIRESCRGYLRAIVGGLLVGLPLLWTQEMWDNGSILEPFKIVLLLAVGLGITVGFNAVSGFRRERTWPELLLDSVEGMGLSILVAAAALFVLGRLGADTGVGTVIGRIALLAIPVAFGTALAATLLSESDEGGGRDAVGPIARLLMAAGGALYFALNVAPTQEVRMVGAEADVPLLLLAIGASLGIGLATEAEIGLGGRRSRRRHGDGPIDGPVGATIAVYAVALLVSLILLWSFGLTDGLATRAVVGQVVMLGVVATFGAAAGRLLVRGEGAET